MNWPTVRLGDLISDTRNGLYKHADYYGRGTPILKMFNLQGGRLNLDRIDRVELNDDELAAYSLHSGDILMNRVNSPELVGKCAVIPSGMGDTVFESKNIRIRLRPEIAEPTFFAAYLNSNLGRPSLCQGIKHAIGMATINNGDVRNCIVPLPPLREQRRIVEILRQAEVLRQKRTEADALADRVLPALFHKLFGDPATNPRNQPFVPLGELATRVTKGESPGWQGFQYQDSGPVFVTSENVRWGTIDLSEPKHIPLEFHQKLNRSALKPRDILINLVGASIGRSCLVPIHLGDANVNQAVAVVTCGPRLLPEYLASLLLTPAAQARLHGGKVEAARANISLIDVRRFPVLLPPLAAQQRFVAMRQEFTKVLQQRNEVQQNMRELFAALLHRAFGGDLTAKWRQTHMKELLPEMEQQARLLNLPSPERN